MLTCLCFQALFLGISGPAKISIIFWSALLVLWCLVFQHLANTCVFTWVFPFEFVLRCSGALFSRIWRPSVLDSFRLFGVVLDGLWPPRLWSGRSVSGSTFLQFVRSPLLRSKWSPGCCPNAQKHMVLGHFVRKGRCAEIVKGEPDPSESNCFPEFFCEFRRAPFGPKRAG